MALITQPALFHRENVLLRHKIPQWRCHTCQKVFNIILFKKQRRQGKLCFRNTTMSVQN